MKCLLASQCHYSDLLSTLQPPGSPSVYADHTTPPCTTPAAFQKCTDQTWTTAGDPGFPAINFLEILYMHTCHTGWVVGWVKLLQLHHYNV